MPFESSFIGLIHAARQEKIIVRIIVRVPDVQLLIIGIIVNNPLHRALTSMTHNMFLSFFAGGMIMAINMPYNDTLSAVTTLSGRMLPAVIPMAHPDAQNIVDINAAA